jgi:putative transposase
MTERFRNKYRSATTRLHGYDYGRMGVYFVTICTRKKISYFGDIIDNKMMLSDLGIMVKEYWIEIPTHFPIVSIDEFVIMPDHIHGIIMIKPLMNGNSDDLQMDMLKLGVSTGAKSRNPFWNSNSLGLIINQFKRICTIKSKELGLDLVWQLRFYDHIIRSKIELENTRQYIWDNVNNWNQ